MGRDKALLREITITFRARPPSKWQGWGTGSVKYYRRTSECSFSKMGPSEGGVWEFWEFEKKDCTVTVQ
jgi:hypothetical protein